MGGHSHHSTTKIENIKKVTDTTNEMKTGADIKNVGGTHNISTGEVGKNADIFLQNLQQSKPTLQQLGANAVYVPESNSLVLLIWRNCFRL